jgi:hypothetical protein
MFIPKFGATRQIIQPTVTNLQPVKDAINGMKARYRTNESLPLKPRIEASYAVFKEYIKDLPKDQKAASKQVFVREMSTLLRIDSAPILALLQKKNEVSGPCIEAMVTAKNALQALPAERKPSATDVATDAKDLTPPIGVSGQRKLKAYEAPSANAKRSDVPTSQLASAQHKLPTYAAPAADAKRSETPPLSISTAGQNPHIVTKKDEEKLQTDVDQLAIAEGSFTTAPLGNAANTESPRKALLASIRSIRGTQSRSSSVDSIMSHED